MLELEVLLDFFELSLSAFLLLGFVGEGEPDYSSWLNPQGKKVLGQLDNVVVQIHQRGRRFFNVANRKHVLSACLLSLLHGAQTYKK